MLRVLKVNERARQFYERLGLQVSGELPRHWAMELPPPGLNGYDADGLRETAASRCGS